MMNAAKHRLQRMRSVARDVAGAVRASGHTATRAGARDVRLTPSANGDQRHAPVAQSELQEDIQRFTGELIERVGQASSEVEASGEGDEISTQALRRVLNYESAALDI